MLKTSKCLVSDSAETRTLDPLIKSQLLYQLSYGVSYKILPFVQTGVAGKRTANIISFAIIFRVISTKIFVEKL